VFRVGVLLLLCHGLWAQQNLRGLLWEDNRYNQLPIHPLYGKSVEVGPAFSNKATYPRVINQSVENTAVTWSTAWYAMGALYTTAMPKEQAQFSPAFTYRDVLPATQNCTEPVSLIDALESLRVKGIATGKTVGFHCLDSIRSWMYDSAARFQLPGYARLFNTFDAKQLKVDAIKRAITKRNAVVAGIICPNSFQYAKEFWSPVEKPLPEYGGHTVVVVGYDDQKYGGAFEIVNSWGKAWGRDGYSWLRYDDVAAFVPYAFELFSPAGKIDVEIRFTLENGTEMPAKLAYRGLYKFLQPYKSGDAFKIDVFGTSPVFIAVIGIDAGGQHGQLFPSAEESSVLYSQRTVPSASTYITLDGAPGTNGLLFLFSRTQAALDALLAKIKERGPSVVPLNYSKAVWEKNNIRFSDSGTLSSVLVEVVQQ
jgi:hypothetical protein